MEEIFWIIRYELWTHSLTQTEREGESFPGRSINPKPHNSNSNNFTLHSKHPEKKQHLTVNVTMKCYPMNSNNSLFAIRNLTDVDDVADERFIGVDLI